MAAAQERHVLGSGVELVTLDFRAVGQDRKPITDLRPGDLSLKIDGRPREIRSLQFVRAGGDGASAVEPTVPIPRAFGSNQSADVGRSIILVIENESLRAGTDRQATDAAARFVRTLPASDRVALLTMPRGGLNVDLTADHEKVAEALGRISGQGSTGTTASDKACRTRLTLEALDGLLGGLAASEGPKTVIIVSSGLIRPTRDAPINSAPGACEVRLNHYEDVGAAASAARAQLYVILPEDLVVDSAATAIADPTASRFRNTDEEIAGLESLAGVTAGILLRLPRGDDSAFTRVARETAGHYLLTFEAQPSERNGQSHRVELRSARADATLLARGHLTIPKPAARSSLSPQAMLRDGRVYRDLPLRVAAYTSLSPGDAKLKVVAVIETVDRSVPLASAAFGLIDPKGRLVAQWTADDRELKGAHVMAAGLAAPGTYRLRAAAIDASGRRGAAEYDLEAQLTPADPLRLSAMVLGVSRGGSFTPKLEFTADPTAMGLFEIYGAATGTLGVALELATSLDGRALIRVPATVVAGDDPQRRIGTGVVPTGALPPGDYVVRAIVTLDGRPIGLVYRTLRKATPP